jgi:hypothetical protein
MSPQIPAKFVLFVHIKESPKSGTWLRSIIQEPGKHRTINALAHLARTKEIYQLGRIVDEARDKARSVDEIVGLRKNIFNIPIFKRKWLFVPQINLR